MVDPIKYHQRIENEQHVFLFTISGRSSSTAFQRIINSSNKVWMWGEPQGIIKQTLHTIGVMNHLTKEDRVKLALSAMYHSYLDNKHMSFYPNAVGNLENTIKALSSSISIFLKPWAPSVKRFGFKEIDLTPVWMLDILKEIYPQGIFIFCFRDPLSQWPSLRKLNLYLSKDLDVFLKAYHDMFLSYTEFAKKHKIKAFVENSDLRELKKIGRIIEYLNIPEIDDTLINNTVHTFKHEELSGQDIEKILNSPAYEAYRQMKKISKSFFK